MHDPSEVVTHFRAYCGLLLVVSKYRQERALNVHGADVRLERWLDPSSTRCSTERAQGSRCGAEHDSFLVISTNDRGKLWSACVRLGAASTTHLVPRPNSSGVGRGMNERMTCTQNSITKARNSPSRQAAPVLST